VELFLIIPPLFYLFIIFVEFLLVQDYIDQIKYALDHDGRMLCFKLWAFLLYFILFYSKLGVQLGAVNVYQTSSRG